MESMFDYGSRCGFWRLHRLFTGKKLPVTVFAVGMALERNIEAAGAMKEAEWEVSSHGYRWWDYSKVDEETEKEHIAKTIKIHQNLLGKRPFGFYQGKPNENTRRLVIEEGGFLYDSDSYADDLPYWTMEYAEGRPHLIIPYTLTENDMRFTTGGWSADDDFANHLKETLRFLVEEGKAGHPKMMTVGLHCRLSRPGRIAAVEKFLDFAKSYGRDVWICTREQIANHWYENHLPRGVGNPIKPSSFNTVSTSSSSAFMGGFGGVGNTYNATTPSSFSNPASKFSYLGNLTNPRDSKSGDLDKTASIKAAAQDADGDII
jgi:allantoinase